MAISIGRTRSSAADIAEPLAGFDDFAGMSCSMFKDMSQATTWKPLGTVTQQIAAKLIALRDGQDKIAVAPEILDSATAGAPAREESGAPRSRTGDFKNSTGAGQSHKSGVNGVGLARPNHQREAGADVFGQSMHASEGNSGAHDLRPLLDSRSSTMTKPEADKRVRSSQ